MIVAIVTVPTSHQAPFAQRRPLSCINPWWHGSTTAIQYPNHLTLPLCCSSSPSSTSVTEEGPYPPPDAKSVIDNSDKLPFRNNYSGCKACGREEVENGCNGEGRIQGGIATVPGFGWWPIKAYRPCPGFVASGGRYRRRGQSMDDF